MGTVCVRPGKFPAKVMVAPNSPRARAQQSTAPEKMAGRSSGSVTRANTIQPLAPRARAASHSGVERAKAALNRDHQERHGDEGLGHHRGRGRERYLDAERLVEDGANEPFSTECEQESDAADDGREDHRQGGQRSHHAAEMPGRFREDEREGYAQDECHRGRRQRAEEREAERGAGLRRLDRPDCLIPRGPHDQAREGEQEEEKSESRQRQERSRNPALAHTPWKPAPWRIAWPSGERTRSMKACAPALLEAPFSAAMGYSAMTFWLSGMAMPSTRPSVTMSLT